MVSHFLAQSPLTYCLRGLTRNTSSAASQALTAKGVEMVAADVDDYASLKRAFDGANAIFSVTDFWHPYNDPNNVNKGKENGMLRNEWAYHHEVQQGPFPCSSNRKDSRLIIPYRQKHLESCRRNPNS